SAERAGQQAALEKISAGLHADVSLFAPDRSLLASVGAALPAPTEETEAQWPRSRMMHSPTWTVRLPDSRWLVVRRDRAERFFRHIPGLALVLGLALLLIAVAIAAHPVVRRLTRRLERLQDGVETLGRGDFSA